MNDNLAVEILEHNGGFSAARFPTKIVVNNGEADVRVYVEFTRAYLTGGKMRDFFFAVDVPYLQMGMFPRETLADIFVQEIRSKGVMLSNDELSTLGACEDAIVAYLEDCQEMPTDD